MDTFSSLHVCIKVTFCTHVFNPNENFKAEIISFPMSLLSKALLTPWRSFDSCSV